MIKLIVSDLDGTLLGFDKKIKEEDKRAIQLAIENGIDFAVASGRMDIEILEVLKEIEQKAHRVSQNGAYIYTKTDVSLHSAAFEPDIARQIYKEAKQLEAIVLVCNENTNFIEEMNEHVSELQKRLFYGLCEVPNMSGTIGADILPSKITVLAENEVITSFQQQIMERFGDVVDTFISEPRCLDIMPKNISKGNALRSLMNHLDVQPEETACFGDAFNDIPMFRLTPYSFVMSHAHPDVKKEARYIVDSVSEAVQIILTEINQPNLTQK